jgi:hypothetical protein
LPATVARPWRRGMDPLLRADGRSPLRRNDLSAGAAHDAAAQRIDARREPLLETARARAVARAPAMRRADRRMRESAASALGRDGYNRRRRCRSKPRSAADQDKARETSECCPNCATRGRQSSGLRPLHYIGGQCERDGQARARSAPSAYRWSGFRTVTTNELV